LFTAGLGAKKQARLCSGGFVTKIACVAVVKDEAPYIAEWIAYQFKLGFNTILLLDNGSSDQTVSEALAIAAGGADVRISDWHMTGRDYQIRAFEYAARRLSGEFDWVAFFDADEFLVFSPELNLRDCLAARGDTAAIGVPWAIFGSSFHQVPPAGGVVKNFCHRSDESFGPNRHIKSIIRPASMISCINPHMFEISGRYRDVMGADLAFEAPGILARMPDYRAAKLHHYFTRSWHEWQQKLRRGYHDLTRTEDEFFQYDRNEVYDDAALRFILTGAYLPGDPAARPI